VADGYLFEIDTGSGTTSRKLAASVLKTYCQTGLTPQSIGLSATVTTTELDYVDGVTSAIQTQLDSKVPSSRTITASTGLTGGGDLSANRSLALDINGLSVIAPAAGDSIPFYDASGTTIGKATITSINGVIDHGTLAGNSDDDHTQYAKADGTRWTTTPAASRVAVTDGSSNLVVSLVTTTELGILDGATVTTTELNYVSGVTSAIQTQLGGKVGTGTTISAGGALTGGGDLSTNRTISLDITGMTSTTVASSDELVVYDVSITAYRKITASQIMGITDHGGLSGLADDDHTQYSKADGTRWTTTPTASRAVYSDASGNLVVSTVTATELGKLSGLTASTAELNTMTGITSTTAELNKIDGFTGDVDDLNEIAGLADNDQTIRVGRNVVTVSTTGAVTLGTTHQNGFIYCTNSSTTTFTIPPNSTTAYPTGTEMTFWRSDASVVVTEGSGVTLNGHDGTNGITSTATIGTAHTGLTIKKVATDTWICFGRFTSS
jgi:hypothetical protein